MYSTFAPIKLSKHFWNFIDDAICNYREYGGEIIGSFSLTVNKGYYEISGYRLIKRGNSYYLGTVDLTTSDHIIAHSHPNMSSEPSGTDINSLLRSNSIDVKHRIIMTYKNEIYPPRPVPYIIVGFSVGNSFVNIDVSAYLPKLSLENVNCKRIGYLTNLNNNLKFKYGEYYYCNLENSMIKHPNSILNLRINNTTNVIESDIAFISVGAIDKLCENQDLYLLNFIKNKFQLKECVVLKIFGNDGVLYQVEFGKNTCLKLVENYMKVKVFFCSYERSESILNFRKYFKF